MFQNILLHPNFNLLISFLTNFSKFFSGLISYFSEGNRKGGIVIVKNW